VPWCQTFQFACGEIVARGEEMLRAAVLPTSHQVHGAPSACSASLIHTTAPALLSVPQGAEAWQQQQRPGSSSRGLAAAAEAWQQQGASHVCRQLMLPTAAARVGSPQ
jgi:hypothetical protein